MPKSMEERIEDFSEEIDDFGDRLGTELERFDDELGSYNQTLFGVFGPFLWSLVGLILIGILVWILNSIGEAIPSTVFIAAGDFILDHLALLFLLLLLFNYFSYFSKRYPDKFKYFSPLTTALSIVVWIWIIGRMLLLMEPQFDLIRDTVHSLHGNLITIFLLLVVLCYILLLIKEGRKYESRRSEGGIHMEDGWEKDQDIKRLYRSKKDKLLGGVCGGIGEYFEVDPVIVRIIWVVLAIASLGTAILVYIILWILIPRNPGHGW